MKTSYPYTELCGVLTPKLSCGRHLEREDEVRTRAELERRLPLLPSSFRPSVAAIVRRLARRDWIAHDDDTAIEARSTALPGNERIDGVQERLTRAHEG